MSNEKINEQILKLENTNVVLNAKIAVNRMRLRALVGKLAGVQPGDVVVSKGQRYHVLEILSDVVPKKGKPLLSGKKIAKNGNFAKRPVEIKGAWIVIGRGSERKTVRVSSKRGGGKILTKKPAKRGSGRPSKKSLEDFTILGTA